MEIQLENTDLELLILTNRVAVTWLASFFTSNTVEILSTPLTVRPSSVAKAAYAVTTMARGTV